ncbi:MAG: VanZ family protein [Lacunisphaera sp.]
MPTESSNRWNRQRACWALALAATIIYESSCSQLAGPDVPGIDKVEHALIYGLLATLVVRSGFVPKYGWVAVLLVSLFGVSDEWHQSFTPGRSVEFGDWLADTCGAALAVALYVYWGWYRRLLEIVLWRQQTRIENRSEIGTNVGANDSR